VSFAAGHGARRAVVPMRLSPPNAAAGCRSADAWHTAKRDWGGPHLVRQLVALRKAVEAAFPLSPILSRVCYEPLELFYRRLHPS
jgi:hypothetical protein